jgi:NAD(P)-dependent dehydrogenase (short-subunit alcohol dehydrogenase family)
MRRVLVTGTNRGLGLEFTRQLLARGDRVIAACRDPQRAAALNELASAHPDRLHLLAVEMTDADSIAALAQQAAQRFDALDLLVNNAGRLVRGERFGAVAADALNSSLQTNAVGPFLLTQALAPLLAKGDAPVVANLSSQLGSIARTDSFYTPSYAISKAALNMATVLLAHALAGDGVRVVAFHPGWVKTDMGGAGAPLLASESAAALLRIIDALKPDQSGMFLDYQGSPMPW